MRPLLSSGAPSPEVRPGIEKQALVALRAAHPDLACEFPPALRRARAVGLGKLWVALAREELGGVRAELRGGRAILRLADGGCLTAPPAVMHAFADHQPGLVAEVPGGVVDHPADLLAAVAAAGCGDSCGWDDLMGELAESVANHALALVGETWRRRQLRFDAEDPTGTGTGTGAGAPGAVGRASARVTADPGFSLLALFEQAIADGHPLHPCARIR